MKWISALVLVACLSSGCSLNSKPVVTPTPANQKVVGALVLVEEVASALGASGVIPPADATVIVKFAGQAVNVAEAAPSGWKTTIETALIQADGDLSASTQKLIAPYLSVVEAILALVP